ncbi:MAG: hypothetical protein ACRC2K_03320 [Clostridium sp.]
MINYGRNEYYVLPSVSERSFLSKGLKEYCKNEKICCYYFCTILNKLLNR